VLKLNDVSLEYSQSEQISCALLRAIFAPLTVHSMRCELKIEKNARWTVLIHSQLASSTQLRVMMGRTGLYCAIIGPDGALLIKQPRPRYPDCFHHCTHLSPDAKILVCVLSAALHTRRGPSRACGGQPGQSTLRGLLLLLASPPRTANR
jgi:hypothetical protein